MIIIIYFLFYLKSVIIPIFVKYMCVNDSCRDSIVDSLCASRHKYLLVPYLCLMTYTGSKKQESGIEIYIKSGLNTAIC